MTTSGDVIRLLECKVDRLEKLNDTTRGERDLAREDVKTLKHTASEMADVLGLAASKFMLDRDQISLLSYLCRVQQVLQNVKDHLNE